jgi:hypothetical protein
MRTKRATGQMKLGPQASVRVMGAVGREATASEELVHGRHHGVDTEWLRQPCVRVKPCGGGGEVRGGGDQEHLRVMAAGGELLLSELESIHARQHHVEDHQVRLPTVALREGIDPVDRDADLVTVIGDEIADRLPERLVVLHDENPATPAHRSSPPVRQARP